MKLLDSTTTKLGNKIELIGENPSGNSVLIIGVFHGDEPQGKYLIEEYLKGLSYGQSPSPLSSPQGVEDANNIFYHSHNYTNYSNLRSKELRKNSTDAEQKLWNILRRNQIHGLHFKRQKPIGNYVVDFICLKEKVVIELDGGQHNEGAQILHDKERTFYLNSLGYKVLRIWNNEITENIEGVKEFLYNALAPLGRGEGRGAKSNLLFIPCLNPDGLQNGTRTNANGVDLNRNFPTHNWGGVNAAANDCAEHIDSCAGTITSAAGDNPSDYYGGSEPASEIETRFLIDTIEKYSPKLILTLHAPYKVVNYDGPAESIAQKISKIINYPVEASIGYPTPGSFGTYCGVERSIPTITLELDEKIPVEDLIQPVFEIFDIL